MVVKVLRWPADFHKREQCEVLGLPRLLVVEGGAALPTCLDALEDWVRPPISQEELKVRTATLEARARHNAQPLVDSDEILCFGNRRLQLSAGEARLMRLFVEHYGSVVPRELLAEGGWPNEDAPRRNALDLRILRLRRRVEPLSLSIRTVWGRGYLLEAAAFPLAAVAR